MAITWRNIGNTASANAGASLAQSAANTINTGLSGIAGLATDFADRNKDQDTAMRKSQTANVLDGLMKYSSVEDLQAAQQSGDIASLLGANRFADREVVRTAVDDRQNSLRDSFLKTNQFDEQKNEIATKDSLANISDLLYAKKDATGAREAIDEDDRLTAAQKNTEYARVDSFLSDKRQEARAIEQANIASKRFGWEKLEKEANLAADSALGNIAIGDDYYTAQNKLMESIRDLPWGAQEKAMQGFDAKYALANKIAPADVANIRTEEETLRIAEQQEIDKATNEMALIDANISKIPFAARSDSQLKTEAALKDKLYSTYNLDRDWVAFDEGNKGVTYLLDEVDKELKANPKLAAKLKAAGITKFSLAFHAVQLQAEPGEQAGDTRTMDLRNTNGSFIGADAADYVTSAINDLTENDYVGQYTKYNEEKAMKSQYIRDVELNLPTKLQGITKKYQNQRRLLNPK